MRIHLQGQCRKPAALVIASWEPFLPQHESLCRELVASCQARGLSPVVAFLYPPAGRLNFGCEGFQPYEPFSRKLSLIRATGVEALLLVKFESRTDLQISSRAFFTAVCSKITLQDVWLGASQSLGTGPENSSKGIRVVGVEQGFNVRILPPEENNAPLVRALLSRGYIAAAASIAGRPPLVRRSTSDSISLSLPPGVYRVSPVNSPQDLRVLELTKSKGAMCKGRWPFPSERLMELMEGPGDTQDKSPAHQENNL